MCLSKSMEKSFLALKNAKAREAYVEAELVHGLAHQIRIIRRQRGLTQKQLAEKMGTTQTTVSRLEDPSYGRYSMRSLLALSKVFDVALFVRFMSFSKFMPATWNTRPDQFEASSYDEEAPSILFFNETKARIYEAVGDTSALDASWASVAAIKPKESALELQKQPKSNASKQSSQFASHLLSNKDEEQSAVHYWRAL